MYLRWQKRFSNDLYLQEPFSTDKDGNEIPDIGTAHWYWSSTEYNYKYGEVFCAWVVYMIGGSTGKNPKNGSNYVRAVSAF